MIKLQRLNVVKFVASESKAKQLESQGFVRVEEEKKTQRKTKTKSNEGGE